VKGYWYGVSTGGGSPDRWVAANSNGVAVVTLTPIVSGFSINRLTVIAEDSAGNQSTLPSAGYSFGFRANEAAGWWSTAGGSGSPITDLTGNNDLDLYGGASLGSDVLTLDGASGEATTGGPVLDTTDSYTVSVWVKPTALSEDRMVVSQDGWSESAFTLGYVAAESAWCLTVAESDEPSPSVVRACSSTAPALNQWTHLVGVYDLDTAQVSLYVDGTLAASEPVAALWPADGVLAVGRGLVEGSATGWFAGQVADVKVWQRVLDPDGVTALAAASPV
jgi:hypothetical protein